MSIPNIPSNFFVTQANGQVLCQWDIASGATSYVLQRSIDGVAYVTIASPTAAFYVDATVTTGVQYWYQVSAVGTSGVSPYTVPQSVVPTPTGEMSLGELRTRSQQRADRLNSQFITLPEWNFFINQAMFELYDLLINVYEDLYIAPVATFQSTGNTYLYDLPDGKKTFLDNNLQPYVAAPFYRLRGVDLGISSATNAWVSVPKFMFEDRNKYVYPNSASTIYGVFNLQYRLLGSQIEFIPTPSTSQYFRLWYIPRLRELLKDQDITTTGISGWLQYVIVRAAKYALDKEESDTQKLDEELVFLKKRIEESAINRDVGYPDRISDVRGQGLWGVNTGGYGYSGPVGGW
jgi:hypothetical protein